MVDKWDAILAALAAGRVPVSSADVRVYPQSYAENGGARLVMVRDGTEKYLLAAGAGALFDELRGQRRVDGKVCPLSHENRQVLNHWFGYTVPRAFGAETATIGLGDRLGLASPGHIRIVRGRDVRPILAQQSVRELTLTGRTFRDVLDAASFAAFQEGYRDGFGADGDHLKTDADIREALDCGFSMLTLDCSEKIDHTVEHADDAVVESKYAEIPEDVRRELEQRYLDRSFSVGGHVLRFDRRSFVRTVLIYARAVDFMAQVYRRHVENAGRPIDFEISIDETLTPTTPEAHFFVANELYERKVRLTSMAPRFCGEFQKGIDYIGDVDRFERELRVHAAIADHFGYKLSIHSGSDKFSVFPLIARHTRGRFHLKTAGTNWLEAVRVVARVRPDLYRRMHEYARRHVGEALKYYHVTADFAAIRPLDETPDEDLPAYLDDKNARQMMHITYGLLLRARDESGRPLFKDEFFRTLIEREDEYDAALAAHIGRHLELLGK